VEVIPEKSVHRIPHRTNDILMGVVNLRGQLALCVNLRNLLNIQSVLPSKYKRMVAIQKDREGWVFPVDEVCGVYDCPADQSIQISDKYIFNWNDQRVSLLDDEWLFSALRHYAK
jgi:chemotaxis-related protein WspD